MKQAHAIVVGSDLTNVSHLRTVKKIWKGVDELDPYQQEIESIETMYKSIWRFHIYIDSAHAKKKRYVAMLAELQTSIDNDPLLANENDDGDKDDPCVFDVIRKCKADVPDSLWKLVSPELDALPAKFRQAGAEEELLVQAKAAIIRAKEKELQHLKLARGS